MEFMDKGSLDGIYKQIGPIDIDIVGKVALAVLEGLTYLYDVHRIIHRGEIFERSVLRVPSPLVIESERLLLKRFTDMLSLFFVRVGTLRSHRHKTLQHPLQLQRANQNL